MIDFDKVNKEGRISYTITKEVDNGDGKPKKEPIGVIFDRKSYGLKTQSNENFRVSFLINHYRLLELNGDTFETLGRAKNAVQNKFHSNEPTEEEVIDIKNGKAVAI